MVPRESLFLEKCCYENEKCLTLVEYFISKIHIFKTCIWCWLVHKNCKLQLSQVRIQHKWYFWTNRKIYFLFFFQICIHNLEQHIIAHLPLLIYNLCFLLNLLLLLLRKKYWNDFIFMALQSRQFPKCPNAFYFYLAINFIEYTQQSDNVPTIHIFHVS